MNTQRQITCAAHLDSLSVFREVIKSACLEHGNLSEEFCYDLQLAVDEACTNIITHGYAGMNPGSIIMNLVIDESQATIVLTDFGHSFEPADAPMPDVQAALEDRPMGGFGLYFIYQTMDHVSYEATEDGNRMTLVKQIDASKSDPVITA